jgi:hypothetical protein
MMWIDIPVTVLLTLRTVLFRPALPQLPAPNNDAWLQEGKDEQQECLFVGDEEVNEHSPRESSPGNSGVSQLHILVMTDSKVRR